MRFRNGRLFLPDGQFHEGGFRIENGRFAEIDLGASEGEDLHGMLVIPGLVDIHHHGNSGKDFSDGDAAGLEVIARYLASRGVTSFCPTSMSLPFETLKTVFASAAALKKSPKPDCANIAGIHMEGPYVNPVKAGAQNPAYLRLPSAEEFHALQTLCGDLVRIVSIAPELEGALAFTKSANCTVSAAHTNATYEEASAFFDAGGRHITHLYNAMPPLHHRNPGVIGAGMERDFVTAELICDGYHVHPSSVRAAFRLFPNRICLISDALRCCAMPNGAYELSGQTVTVTDGVARLHDGTIAGAASDLLTDLQNAVSFGIPKEQAILAATATPAKAIGLSGEIGCIAAGARADFLIMDDALQLQTVYLQGAAI